MAWPKIATNVKIPFPGKRLLRCAWKRAYWAERFKSPGGGFFGIYATTSPRGCFFMENKTKQGGDLRQYASLYEKGVALYSLGNFQEAIEIFDEILKTDNWNEYAIDAKHDSLVAVKSDKEAIKYLEYKKRILEKERNEEIRENEDRGKIERERQQKIDDGEIDKEDEYGGLDYDDWTGKQNDEYEAGSLREMIIKFDEDLKSNPKDTEVMRSKAWALYLLGEGRQAFDLYDAILNFNPDYPIGNFIDDIEHLK